MKQTQFTAKTYEEALAGALAEIGLTLEQVDVEIVEQGSKGLFGLLGKFVRVEVTQKDTPALRAQSFLLEVTRLMDLNVNIEAKMAEDNALQVDIDGDMQGVLIGYRGETLDALQYLTSLQVNRGASEYYRVVLDTQGYRAKREQTLVRLAERLATKARRTHKRVTLEPMNPYERRILHSALQDFPGVATHSEGEEPNRRVVILPK